MVTSSQAETKAVNYRLQTKVPPFLQVGKIFTKIEGIYLFWVLLDFLTPALLLVTFGAWNNSCDEIGPKKGLPSSFATAGG